MSAQGLREEGMAALRANDPEAALALFDRALVEACDDEQLSELITINKAGSLIALERSGPEVQRLAQIVMARRNPRHVYLAAYQLQNKFSMAGDFRRASFYAQIALQVSEENHEPEWKVEVLFALGILSGLQSRFTEAIQYHEEVLRATPKQRDPLRRALTLQNLGYSFLQTQESLIGVSYIHQALELLSEIGAETLASESYIDLCLGYLDMGELEKAKTYGEIGLTRAVERRQIRNAHYLLGEVEFKQGDPDAARSHFELLARHYPDFPHLEDLLLAIDLRSLVNFKL